MFLVCVYFGSKFLEFSILEVEGDHTKNVLLHAIKKFNGPATIGSVVSR